MADDRCLVTVVGERKRVDLAIPARSPIAEYAPRLAGLCGQDDDDALPGAWSLGLAGHRTLPLATSLAEAGVADGQTLYLRDLGEGEADEPIVLDLDELVTDAAERGGGPPWDARARALTTLLAGLLWLVAASAVLSRVAGVSPLTGPLAAGVGLTLPLVALTMRRRGSRTGPAAVLTALGAVPCLAVAGWLLPGSAPSGGATMAAAVGANLGALAALAAVPGLATVAVELGAVIAAALAGLLLGIHAHPAQGAAVVAVVCYGLLTLAPWAAGQLAAVAPFRSRRTRNEVEVVPSAVRSARALLVGWTAATSAILAIALVVLAGSGTSAGLALSACLAVAVLLRAGTARLAIEVVPAVAAGAAGLFAVFLHPPAWLAIPADAAPLPLFAAGTALLAAGLLALQRPARPDSPRPRWLGLLSTGCAMAGVPLMLAVLGAFQHLVSLGQHL
jgi:type VII secretion integral membrane protein EccD